MIFRHSLSHAAAVLTSAALVSIALPAAAWAQQGEPYYHPHMWGEGGHGWFLGPLMMVVLVAVLVAAVVLLVRWLAPAPVIHAAAGRGPLDILKERFARGEIDKAEYEERRHVLGE
jgi:putative membrane protein